MKTKICSKCKRELPATKEYWYSDKSRNCWLSHMCKVCKNEYFKRRNGHNVETQKNIREYKYEWDVLYTKCTKCWKWGDETFFYNDEYSKFGRSSSCRECRRVRYGKEKELVNKQYRNYYDNNKTEIIKRIRNNEATHTGNMWFSRWAFHDRAIHFVRRNWLRPSKCSICWREWKTEMHHPSYECYEKWSEVIFCCKLCHRNIHLWRIECPKPINLLECKSPLKDAE